MNQRCRGANGSAFERPLAASGDSGTGKSHLLTASGTAAAEQGHRVRYTLASKLVNEIDRASNSADGCGEPGQPAFLARASVTDTGHSKFSPRR